MANQQMSPDQMKAFNKVLEERITEANQDKTKTKWKTVLPDLMAADYDKYVQDKIDAATAEKKESAEDCEQYIRKDSSSLNEKLTEYVWNTSADGKATLFENEEENCVYVVVRDDVTTMKTWLETQNEGILHGIKDDAFDEMLKSTYDSYSVELNDYLVNTKYAPEKLRGIGK